MPCLKATSYTKMRLGRSTNAYHVIPGRDDRFHVKIAREERNDTIRYNLAIFHQDCSKIPNNGWVVSYFKARADGDLITASGYDLLSHDQVNAIRGGAIESRRTSGRKALRVKVIAYVS